MIRKVERSDLNELGLVIPPTDMMFRLSKHDLARDESMASEMLIREKYKSIGWEMYQYSYRVKSQRRICGIRIILF